MRCVSVVFTEIYKYLKCKNVKHIAYSNAKKNVLFNEKMPNLNVRSNLFLLFKRYINLSLSNSEKFIFHSTYYRYCKSKNAINVTTLHDFTYEYFRKDLISILHKIQKRNAVKHSKAVICISNNTKNDLLKFYPKYNGVIKVIYNGYDNENYYKLDNVEKKKIILFVGARNSYKRFDFAIDLLTKLDDMKFIIIGGGELTKNEEKILNTKLNNRWEKCSYLSENELCKLYNEATFLCYPSEYEGFGIPVLEAQACGCPVICQKKSSIPEVANDAAIYIDSEDYNSSVNIIKNVLNNKEIYSKLVDEGLKNVQKKQNRFIQNFMYN